MQHEVEIQNEEGMKVWSGRATNDRRGFENLIGEIRTMEKSNEQSVEGVFMKLTGNYHMPVKHFLEYFGLKVYVIDARKTYHSRIAQDLRL